MNYRLHIDIPILTGDMNEAANVAKTIMEHIHAALSYQHDKFNSVNYRLGHDEDRQKSNYLDLNEKGHCSNKKLSIDLNEVREKRQKVLDELTAEAQKLDMGYMDPLNHPG